VAHPVRKLAELAFAHVGHDWRRHVEVDPRLVRPAEVDFLVGDASRARKELGWKPTVDFEGLVKMMVDHDLAVLRNGTREAAEHAGLRTSAPMQPK
jgi:GDPmannose 4,6-dehydratase